MDILKKGSLRRMKIPRCVVCGERYKLTMFNQSETCEDCTDSDTIYEEVDPATEIDITYMKSPSGKVPARFSEVDMEDDSFGF
jgi:hypothetical protein